MKLFLQQPVCFNELTVVQIILEEYFSSGLEVTLTLTTTGGTLVLLEVYRGLAGLTEETARTQCVLLSLALALEAGAAAV